jgi:serine/threonine protein kinase
MNATSPTSTVSPNFESDLIGVSLADGWNIRALRDDIDSGAIRIPTVRFDAINSAGEKARVVILDLRLDGNAPDELKDLELRLQVFNYQRDLVERLANDRLRGIVRALHTGSIAYPLAPLGRLYYLIFEWSEDDLRSQVSLHEKFDVVYAIRVLHQAATALHELHFREVAHQSIRPADVLIFDGQAKLGELSCAVHGRKPRPDGSPMIDWTCAPPEVLYKAPLTSLNDRLLIDLYQLGSLIAYLFSGTSLSTQLGQRLHAIHHWRQWTGSFADALPHVNHAFSEVLRSLEPTFPSECRAPLLTALRELCAPDPSRRGHPLNIAGQGIQSSTERYISLFDLLGKRVERALRENAR